jgi:uncharacterized membrane protein
MISLSGFWRLFAFLSWPTPALVAMVVLSAAVLIAGPRVLLRALGVRRARIVAPVARIVAAVFGLWFASGLLVRLVAPKADPLYDTWRIVSLSPLPAPVIAALSVVAAVMAFLARGSLRGDSMGPRRRLATMLRVAVALALVLLVTEPGRRLLQTTRIKNRVALLLDKSASMGFPEKPGGDSRAQAVASFLSRSSSDLSRLAQRFTLEFYGFDRDVEPIDSARIADPLDAKGGRTDILGAVRSVAANGASAGRKLSGVILLSDGTDNVELHEGLTSKAKDALSDLGAPVDTIAVGSGGLRDLAIERVAVEDFAFVRNTVTVEAIIKAHGIPAQTIDVVLRREGRLVATTPVQLNWNKDTYSAKFSFIPDQTGQFVYTVAAPIFPEEAVTTNNARSFVLKVIRDRVRVLFVVGHPSWDERFIRGLLRQDPNVDLISFFILRSSGNNPKVMREDELSLIPFPVNEIFREQLHTFDLVILQNFAHRDRAYEMDRYLPDMRDYVHEGGALVMIGGENAFGEGKYQDTPLGDALPVEGTGQAPTTENFQARLTPEGRRHPVTQAALSAGEAERVWADMPPLSGINVTRAKPGAQVLLEDPFLNVDGKNAPVVAVWDYGRGRVMAVTADSSWHWAFPALASGSAVRPYDRFWGNAIRWLVRDPQLTPVRLQADKAAVEPGDAISATVSAHGSDYGPAPGAQISVELVDADQGRTVARNQVTAGPDGNARVEFTPPAPGPYRIVAHATKGETPLGDAEDAVAVRAAGPELSDASPRPELLKAISDATGGRSVELDKASLLDLPLVDPEVVEVGQRRDEPLWDRWYSLAIIAGAVGLEWLLRRRWGFI